MADGGKTKSKMKKVPSTFEEFGFNDWLVQQCVAVGMAKPTEIQTNCIPAIMEGRYSLWLDYILE